MKCPKCGFNSFEFYDFCKKCSSDLTGYKQTYAISSMVLPLEAKERLAEQFMEADGAVDQNNETPETHDDIFSFDLPDDDPAPAQRYDDPFNFDEPVPDTTDQTYGSKPESDVFADLLESTSHVEDSPFAASMPSAPPVPPSASTAEFSSGPGEFDLESFSWDETPSPAASPSPAETEPADDFDSLFGDAKDNPLK